MPEITRRYREDGAGDGVGGTVENRGDSTEPENTAAPNGDNASGHGQTATRMET